MHDSFGWGWWVLGSVGMVAFWGLVIWAILTLVRGGGIRADSVPADERRPVDILEARLARGEISVEEYERIRHALHDDEGPPGERRSEAALSAQV